MRVVSRGETARTGREGYGVASARFMDAGAEIESEFRRLLPAPSLTVQLAATRGGGESSGATIETVQGGTERGVDCQIGRDQ